MINAIHSSLSALQAFSRKQESVADNTANINTDGFKKTRVTITEQPNGAVSTETTRIATPGPLVYEQGADGQELVEKSNVEISEELPQAMLNRRFYQANIKTVQIADEMVGSLLDIKG